MLRTKFFGSSLKVVILEFFATLLGLPIFQMIIATRNQVILLCDAQ
jgi:hypothetical protein